MKKNTKSPPRPKTTAQKSPPKRKPAARCKRITSGAIMTMDSFAATASADASYPPVLVFMIGFCSKAEGRAVKDNEILQNLNNVRKTDFNAAINDTYHDPAGVKKYPANRPNMALSVRGAAIDVRNDLAGKGVNVNL